MPGIGKTSLLSEVVDHLTDLRVLSCRAAEAERDLGYVGLRDLLSPLGEDGLAAVPPHLTRALDAAMLRAPATVASDAHAVAAATVEVLRSCARRDPIVVVIDDAQWLDHATSRVIGYAARRLGAEPVSFVVSSRSGAELPLRDLARDGLLQMVEVDGLTPAGIQHLLLQRLAITLSRPRLMRLHQATAGNPMFALEIAAGLGPDGTGDLDGAPREIEQLVDGRLDLLGPHALAAVSALAVAKRPTLGLIAAVAGDGALAGLDEAVGAGLVDLSAGVPSFVHPLFRSGVVNRMGRAEARALNLRLADVEPDAVTRGLYLADAALDRDEPTAAILEEVSEEASRRGAVDAAGVLADAAAEISPDGDARAERFASASDLRARTGDLERAIALARAGIDTAQSTHTRAACTYALGYAMMHAARFTEAAEMYDEAARLGSPDTQIEALYGKVTIGYRMSIAETEPPLAALQALIEPGAPIAPIIEQVRVMNDFMTGASVDLATARARAATSPGLRAAMTLAQLLMWSDELDEARVLVRDLLAQQRAHGRIGSEAAGLRFASEIELRAGDLAEAARLADDGLTLALFPGVPAETLVSLHINAALVAVQAGDHQSARRSVDAADAAQDGAFMSATKIACARAFISMMAGDREDAATRWADVDERVRRWGMTHPDVVPYRADFAEMLAETGAHDQAEIVSSALIADGERLGSARALATGLRVRAMVLGARGEAGAASAAFEAALERHEELAAPIERARTLMAMGTLLRRQKAKRAAREALAAASDTFTACGASAWAHRVEEELSRISGRVSSNAIDLTSTEQQIAALVGEGLSNAEIAARLFVSVRTVESNLTRVYRKLGIRGRTELAALRPLR